MTEGGNPQNELGDLLGRSSKGPQGDRGRETMAEHTVVMGDTLSAIALQYYGSAAKEKWMAIYEENKEAIGDDPNKIKPGIELRIPKLG